MKHHRSLPALCAGALIATTLMLGQTSTALAESYAAFTRLSASGALDNGFGRLGLSGENASDMRANAAVLTSGGKIVAVGSASSKFLVVRLLSNGNRDTTFAGDGRVITDFTPSVNEAATAVAVDGSGRIVVAGHAGGQFALARYLSDGRLDTSFGGDGKVVTSISADSTALAHALLVTSDGKIIVAGEARWPLDTFAVARFNANGSLDTSFDRDGKLLVDVGSSADIARAVAVTTGGKLVIAGESLDEDWAFSAVRLNANGSLDTTFSGDGKVMIPFASAGYGADAHALAIDASGKLVLAGAARDVDGTRFALARLNNNGSLDTTFDVDGRVLTDVTSAHASEAYALKIQSNGKLVAAGTAGGLMAAVRYNTNGSLDNTFDNDGKVALDFFPGTVEAAHAVLIDTDGSIVLVGVADDLVIPL